MATGRAQGGVRTALGVLAMAIVLPVVPAAAEEPSLTPPAGPAGLTSPSGLAPAGTSLEQSGPSASQAARDNARPLRNGRSDGGISGELLAACALAVAGGVAAASGAHRRRAAL